MPERTPTALGPLPGAWEVRPLGDVLEKQVRPVEVGPNDTYREIGIRSHGKGIFHKDPIKGVELGDKRVFWVEGNCLTFNIVFAWEGAVAVTGTAEEGMIASHRFPMFSARDQHVIDVEYVRRFFQTPLGVRLLGDASPGGAGRNRTLNQKLLGEVPVPVPPLPEQRKIVAILSSLDDTIESTLGVIDQLQIVKKAMMVESLTRGVPGRHTRFKQTEIGEVPEEWRLMRIGDLASLGSGTTPSRARADYFTTEGGTAWAKTMDLTDGPVDRTDELVSDLALTETSLRVYPVGTVLIAMYGGFAQIGRTGILRIPAATNQAICPILVGDVASPDFIRVCLEGLRPLWRNIAASSRKDPNITKQDVARFTIPIPGLDEQRIIHDAVTSVTQRQVIEEEKLSHLREVRGALRSVLLTGELRVTPGKAAA